jgi:hypothetical protein
MDLNGSGGVVASMKALKRQSFFLLLLQQSVSRLCATKALTRFKSKLYASGFQTILFANQHFQFLRLTTHNLSIRDRLETNPFCKHINIIFY